MHKNTPKIISNLKKEIKNSRVCHSWFYKEHVLVVEKFALQLCRYYPKANREAVKLSVWLHDIGRAHGYSAGHDQCGAEYAQKLLTENGYQKDFVKLVASACRAHRCKDVMPASIEAKILATADALSHFNQGFYLRVLHFKSEKKGYEAARQIVIKKIERDFHKKLLLKEAKEAARPFYQAWKKALSEFRIK